MRLVKFVAHALKIPRNDAKRLIKKGQITIAGKEAKNAAVQVTQAEIDECLVKYRAEPLSISKPSYIALHKPQGFICSNQDENYPSALKCLASDTNGNSEPTLIQSEQLIRQNTSLNFAGRLDVDTTGLVLLSDDGAWVHRVTSPRSNKAKCYAVTLAEPLTPAAIETLEKGVQLKNEDKLTKPCQITPVSENQVEIEVTEGRYHQVKRMFAAVDNHVLSLHRFSIGGVNLDGLALGEWRFLTDEEIGMF